MIKKIEEFNVRLDKALSLRDMKPVELSKKTGISESTISQYRSGYAKPKENKLTIIADALNVNPVWLMGLDVPMELPSMKIPELNANLYTADIQRAVEMFKTYEIATPEIKAAIDSLLKTVKPISDSSKQIEVPHLKLEVPKSSAELPRLKKDKK